VVDDWSNAVHSSLLLPCVCIFTLISRHAFLEIFMDQNSSGNKNAVSCSGSHLIAERLTSQESRELLSTIRAAVVD
jgi:hypothetical protein